MATKLTDKEWLKRKYIDESKSGQVIADEIGVSVYSVWRALKRHGIKTRRRTSRSPILMDREWLHDQYIVLKKSMKTIAKEEGCSVGVIQSHLVSKGIPTRDIRESVKLAGNKERSGENHPYWKGGRRISAGYVWIYRPEHPKSNPIGYVQEHRIVAEEKTGRSLTSKEVVHHIDGDKQNNEPDNLQVMTRSEHLKLHWGAYAENVQLRQRIIELEERIKELEE